MHELAIAGKTYRSRLLVGTGKYKDFAETRAAIDASGAEIITVAIRRTNIGQDPGQPNLLDALPPSQFTILPNTAGCFTADDAVRTLRLARELLEELAVVAEVGQEVLTTAHDYDDRRVELHFLRCRITGQPRPQQGQEVRWVSRGALRGLAFPPADEALIALLSGGR